MMKYLVKFSKLYVMVLGSVTLILCVLGEYTDQVTVEFIKASALALVPCVLAGMLLFRTGMSLRELWLKRVIALTVAFISFSTVFNFYGLYNPMLSRCEGTYTRFVYYQVFILIAIFIFGGVAFFIADRIERYMIKRINKKLVENEREEK